MNNSSRNSRSPLGLFPGRPGMLGEADAMSLAGFGLGVATSVLAAALVWAGNRYLLPAVRALFWSGTDISGAWQSYDVDPTTGEPVGEAEITQRGSRITMELRRHRHRDGTPASTRYRYSGSFSSRVLTLVWASIDRPDYIVGAMVLYLHAHGREFRGLTIYHDDKAGEVTTHDFWLRRRNA